MSASVCSIERKRERGGKRERKGRRKGGRREAGIEGGSHVIITSRRWRRTGDKWGIGVRLFDWEGWVHCGYKAALQLHGKRLDAWIPALHPLTHARTHVRTQSHTHAHANTQTHTLNTVDQGRTWLRALLPVLPSTPPPLPLNPPPPRLPTTRGLQFVRGLEFVGPRGLIGVVTRAVDRCSSLLRSARE